MRAAAERCNIGAGLLQQTPTVAADTRCFPSHTHIVFSISCSNLLQRASHLPDRRPKH